MDIADISNAEAEFLEKVNNRNRELRNAQNSIVRTGFCLYCGDKCKNKQTLFCSVDCQQDYEEEQRIKNAQYRH